MKSRQIFPFFLLLAMLGAFTFEKAQNWKVHEAEIARRKIELVPYMNEDLMLHLDLLLGKKSIFDKSAEQNFSTIASTPPMDPQEYLTHWQSLPQETKDLLSAKHRKFEELNAQEKAQILARYERFKLLPKAVKLRLEIAASPTPNSGYKIE